MVTTGRPVPKMGDDTPLGALSVLAGAPLTVLSLLWFQSNHLEPIYLYLGAQFYPDVLPKEACSGPPLLRHCYHQGVHH